MARRFLSSIDDVVVGNVRRARRAIGVVRPPRVVGYRGYGTPDEVVLRGRVLESWRVPAWPTVDEHSRRGAFFAIALRFLTFEMAHHEVVARVGGSGTDVQADEEGFVRAVVKGRFARGWLAGEMEPEGGSVTRVRVLVPRADARCMVVSDLDDTVLETGVADTWSMLQRTFTSGPGQRVVTDGAATFFTALTRADDLGEVRAEPRNPVFYLSSSPWNLHGLLERVLAHRGMPEGPLLLNDWGFTREYSLKAPALVHKAEAIRHLLELYPDLPLLLVGDSGEQDPEVYAGIARDHPGRVLGIVIRDLPGQPTGDRLANAGVPTCAAADWEQATRFLVELGWLREVDVETVRDAIDHERSVA